ncbi:MAG: DUF3047 domain-containing protein, partial [Betaproteobacteria bacterium]
MTALALLAALPAAAQAPQLAPFSTAEPGPQPPPWELLTLPKLPKHTRFEIADIDGTRALRAEADASYANLLTPVEPALGQRPILTWRWR